MKFLKKVFCIVGTSPASFTNNVIKEKKNESIITRIIPMVWDDSFGFFIKHFTP
jgi:hypothetical protein